MPVLLVKCEAGRGLVRVDGQCAVDGVTGGKERKTLVKRAFRGVCPCQVPDGEYLQVGWTDICDTPYPEAVSALRQLACEIYSTR